MEKNEEDFTNKPIKAGKSIWFKLKVLLFFVLVGLIIFGYFIFLKFQEQKQEVDSKMALIEAVVREREYCNNLVSKESGNFTDFEYCQRLLKILPKE